MGLSTNSSVSHRIREARRACPGNRLSRNISLPSSAQRLVELHDAQEFLQPNLGQVQFRLKQVAIGIEGVELGIHPSAIAQVGQADPIFQGSYEQFLFFAAFADPLMRDQGIGDFLEGGLNGSLVLNQGTFAFGFGEMDIDLMAPAVKIGTVTCGVRLCVRCGEVNSSSVACWYRRARR